MTHSDRLFIFLFSNDLRKLDEKIKSDVMVCSDDIEAANVIINLAKDGGMNAYYAGGLHNAITIEGLTALLISLNKHYKKKSASIQVSGI